MTAEEMFKKEGYKKSIIDEGKEIAYKKIINKEIGAGKNIYFSLADDKEVIFDSYFSGETTFCMLSKDEMKAVCKQIEELKEKGEW